MSYAAGQRLTAAALNTSLASVPQLIGSTILTSSQPSISISGITGFNHIEAIYTARKDVGGGGAFCWIQFNGDTAAHYQWENVIGGVAGNSGASLVTIIQTGLCAGSSDTAGYFANGRFSIGNIASTTVAKSLVANSALTCSGTTYYTATHGGTWNQAAALTSITLLPDAGNLVAGSSLSIYGWA